MQKNSSPCSSWGAGPRLIQAGWAACRNRNAIQNCRSESQCAFDFKANSDKQQRGNMRKPEKTYNIKKRIGWLGCLSESQRVFDFKANSDKQQRGNMRKPEKTCILDETDQLSP